MRFLHSPLSLPCLSRAARPMSGNHQYINHAIMQNTPNLSFVTRRKEGREEAPISLGPRPVIHFPFTPHKNAGSINPIIISV